MALPPPPKNRLKIDRYHQKHARKVKKQEQAARDVTKAAFEEMEMRLRTELSGRRRTSIVIDW